MSQYTSCTFIYKNCHYCHSEVFIGDMIDKACPSCRKDPFKTHKFKCYTCKFSSDKKKDLKKHFDNTLHKKNLNSLKRWLFE